MADALLSAVRRGEDAAVLPALRVNGCCLLHLAAFCNEPSVAEALVRAGALVNACDRWDETPLHYAAKSGSDACCRVLLRAGADVDAACEAGWTPLHEAARAGSVGCAAHLLAAGADVAAKTAGGDTPTDMAVRCKHPAVASMLRDVMQGWSGLRRAALTAWCCR